MQTINPKNGQPLEIYTPFSNEKIDNTIQSTHEAYLQWRALAIDKRAAYMRELARLLEIKNQQLAELITIEMGKPIAQARDEIKKCAWVCEYFAGKSAEFLANEPLPSDASNSYAAFEPLGVILAIMPWNFPFWQVFRFAAPSLMAGNGCVLKHATNTTGCALEIEQLFKAAGFPENLFRTLVIEKQQVDAVIKHKHVQAVTLTGSTQAGREVASAAGKALKKCVLELGGSDPYLVLADADIETAAKTCATSRLLNNGQSCIAAKRFIVEQTIHDQFVDAFSKHMGNAETGDPLLEDTAIGPLARKDLRDDIHKQVKASIAQGANCIMGGIIPDDPGFFYPPTILTGVKAGMPAYSEELFGPVAAIINAKNVQDAIHIANISDYGLGSAIFTRDTEKGEQIARQLNAGCCFINSLVRSDPRLPFGGIKNSGYGRELSHYGIKEFVNIKTVYIK